jgi:hypothetical protein
MTPSPMLLSMKFGRGHDAEGEVSVWIVAQFGLERRIVTAKVAGSSPVDPPTLRGAYDD